METFRVLRDLRLLLPAALFLAALAVGFNHAWTAVLSGMSGPSFDFLQNLLSEGVGVFISTLAIAPLTALFVERRRERQLAPARVEFLRSVSRQIKTVSDDFVHKFAMFSTLKTTLEYNALQDQIGKFEETLRRFEQGGGPRDEDTFLRDRVVLAASVHADAIRGLGELKNDLVGIERLIEIYTPILDPHTIVRLAELSNAIDAELTNFRCFRNYLRGTASAVERSRALNASVNFYSTFTAVNALLDECDHPELKQEPVALVSVSDQRSIIEGIAAVVDKVFYSEMVEKEEEQRQRVFGRSDPAS